MTRKTQLALLAVLAIGMTTMAYADSPLDQWKAGVPIGKIQCPEDRILMESPSGKPACLTERGSAILLERGYSMVEVRTDTVSDETSIDDAYMAGNDAMETDTVLEEIDIGKNDTVTKTETSNIAKDDAIPETDVVNVSNIPDRTESTDLVFPVDGAHKKGNRPTEISYEQDDEITLSNHNVPRPNQTFSLGDTSYWPKYNMTFPEYALVGEPFTVTYDYTYVIPDEDTGRYTHPEEQCHVDWCERHKFWIVVPTYVDYLDEDAEYSQSYSDTSHIPVRNSTTYTMDPPFDNTRPLQETFTFVINEPDIDYRHGIIRVTIHGSGDGYVFFYVDQDGRITLDDEFVMTAAGQAEAAKLTKKPPPPPVQVVIPEGPREGPPEELFDNAEHALLRYYPDENYEELLQSWNMTQSWIDRFLDAKPNLRSQSFAPVLNWILPSAYGAESIFLYVVV